MCFLLCVIDNYSKYAWVIALKDKKGIAITNDFQKLFKLGKWNDRHPVYYFLKFMLDCRFSLKNVREKPSKCSLKTTDVLLGADGDVLISFSLLNVGMHWILHALLV